jgi:hypothetical protein
VIDKVLPGRRADLRPSTEEEIAQTSVIELSLDEVSAKVRSGGPGDDPEDMELAVWAGVVPFRFEAGDPIPAEDLMDGLQTPDYLRSFRR